MSTAPTRASDPLRLERARDVAAAVSDPELPFLTLADLGMLRDIRIAPDGTLEVFIAPTFLGCPATDVIVEDVSRALAEAGESRARVATTLDPPWSTADISVEGRGKLLANGIAPPPARSCGAFEEQPASCPRCGAAAAREVARFSSTPCKSHFVCRSCGEPFEQFRCL